MANHGPPSIKMVPLGWLNIWPTWWVAKGIFPLHARIILTDLVVSLLPRALWSAAKRATLAKVNYYVATKDGQVAGLTSLYTLIDQPKEIWVGWFGVGAKRRGQGIGEEILRAAMDTARKEGYEILRLWTTDNPNLTAVANRLYKALSFMPETTGLAYYGHPVLIYSLALQGGQPSACCARMPQALVGADFRKIQMKPV
jgi:GNAT superfamily N-acetyltransferase